MVRVIGGSGGWVGTGSSGIKKIAADRLSAAAGSIDITGIPQEYSHLQLIGVGQTSDSAATVVKMQFNGDTSSIYDYQEIDAAATASTMSEAQAVAFVRAGVISASSFTSSPGSFIVDIPFYSGTTFHKTAHVQYGFAIGNSTTNIHWRNDWAKYRSTNAITRITLTPTAGNFVIGTSYTLCGIA